MFSKVLIGVDGGVGGHDAFALARELAEPDAELILGHVWESGAGVTAVITGAPHPAVTGRELLQAELLAADVDCTTVVRSGSSTAAGLHELADELGCDLLVLGSPEHPGPGHALLGYHQRTALHAAPCAVAIAPSGYAEADRSLARVGVGYQETAAGNAALTAAREIAARSGAELDVMLVVAPLPSPWMSEPYAYLAELDDLFGERTREAQLRMDALTDCHAVACRGEPSVRLREFSAGISLLILGSRGYGPVRRMLLGSTSDAVARDAACAVLVLTRPEPDAPTSAGPERAGAARGGRE